MKALISAMALLVATPAIGASNFCTNGFRSTLALSEAVGVLKGRIEAMEVVQRSRLTDISHEIAPLKELLSRGQANLETHKAEMTKACLK